LRAARGGSIDAALVGLGAGTLLCLSSPGESWTFYEIDPEVVRIASDPNYFTFLSQCGPPAGIVLGDGRLMLEREPSARFDLIVLDAFSSDAIPAHLLTTEALGIYLDKLKPGGLALFHVSNRHMELSSVVEAAARQRGLDAWRNLTERKIWTPDKSRRDAVPYVVAVGKTPGSLAGFDADPAWVRARVDNAVPPWTDDFSNVLTAIWRHYQD
jgi:spermidine synthase